MPKYRVLSRARQQGRREFARLRAEHSGSLPDDLSQYEYDLQAEWAERFVKEARALPHGDALAAVLRVAADRRG